MKIEIKNLQKAYNGEAILKNISLTVRDVEAIAILGPSGGGKSTLLRLMSGLEGDYQGRISINDYPVNSRAFKDKIGFVFQSSSLFPHLTLLDNILLILEKIKKQKPEEAKKKVLGLLERFALLEHKDKYPYMLSGGQAQRASIVRSLALDVELFFFDEPTSALDPILTSEVLDTIKELRLLGKEFFIVTHEIAFAKEAADYILFLHDGSIVEQGVKTILDKPQTKDFKHFLDIVLK